MRHTRIVVVVTAMTGVAFLLLAAYLLLLHTPLSASLFCGGSAGLVYTSTTITPDLPRSFTQGAIHAFVSSSIGVIFGGVSYYDWNHLAYDSLPALGSYSPIPAATRAVG